jgi:predicted acyltransferase
MSNPGEVSPDNRQDPRGLVGAKDRLGSIDFFRGVVMFLLIGEGTGFYELLVSPALDGSVIHAIGLQFQHHPWHGLRLWDLGQPFFMFISGVAMVISYGKRRQRGERWRAALGHASRRALVLLVLGWMLYQIRPIEGGGKGGFLLDILPQLAFASLFAFLLLERSARLQAGVALGLIALTELLYRFWPVTGFDQPFVPGRNFGSYVDLALFGKLSEGHWVAFNIVPAAAHMILGVLAGGFLFGQKPGQLKPRFLISTGLVCVAAGLALDAWTPIIRRACTSSFMILSGGLCLLALALACGLHKGLETRKRSTFFVCVGINPIFIYLFTLSGGGEWFRSIAEPFTMSLSGWTGDWPARALTSLTAWALLWALCYGLYRRKVYFKV